MGRAPCCSKVGLHRGPWTPKEDALLTKYIQAHGEGQWRSLPKKAGLLRCGKSCRLRWMNYLRPDIKRGNITSEEEDLIIRLHSLLGNRWSLIAGRLPGRTDNEIKNHWNTHLSKRLRSQGTDPNTHKTLPPTNFDDNHNNSSKKSKKKQNKKKKKKLEKEEEKRYEKDEEREKRTIVYLPKAIRVRALCSPSPSTPSSDSYNNMMNIINNNNNVGRLLDYSNNSTTSGLVNYNNNDNDENNESGLGVFLEDEMVNDEMLVKGSEMERMYDEYLQLLTSQQEEDMLMIQDFDHHHHHLDLESFAQSLLV